MSLDLQIHDRILSLSIGRSEGKIFKHTGDGFLAVFPSLSAAIEASKDIQQEIARQVWNTAGGLTARIAIVKGEAEQRDGDFFGTTLNLLSRLCTSLGSNQVALISLDQPPSEPGLRSIGVHSYRGIEGNFRVFEVEVGLEHLSTRRLTSRLRLTPPPKRTTTFVGRKDELIQIGKLLNQSSIVTLVGTGGIGKSRIAHEIAMESQFLDGVAWISLGSALHDDPLAVQVWRHLSADPVPPEDVLESLIPILEGTELLVVFDSVDAWKDKVAEILPEINERAPGVRFLLTSRSPLACPGEVVLPIQPLPTKSAGVELFVDRARSVRGTPLSIQEVESVAGLIDLLEGIPLAIEIIASRSVSMPIQQIRQVLTDRNSLLKSGQRGRIERHKTLESAFDWTYNHLDETRKITFCGASHFHGPFDVESLCDLLSPIQDRSQTMLSISELVEHSMVQLREGEYSVLDTLRAYGRLKSRELDIEFALEAAMIDYCLRLAEITRPLFKGPQANVATGRLERRRIELRAAAESCIQQDRLDDAAAIVAVLWRMWYRRGEMATGLRSLEPLWQRLLTVRDLEVRRFYGWALYLSGKLQEAENIGLSCLDEAKQAERAFDEAQCLNLLAGIRTALGEHSLALAYYQRSLELAEKDSMGIDVLRLRLNAASALLQLGRYEESLSELDFCRSGFQKIGDRFAEAWLLLNFGINLIQVHRLQEAEEALILCRSMREELDDQRGLVYSSYGLSQLECARGNLAWAKDFAEEGCLAAIQLGDSFAIGAGLVLQIRIAMMERDYSLIAQILPLLEGDPPGARYASSQDDVKVLKSASEILPIVLSEVELLRLRELSQGSSHSEMLGSVLNSRIESMVL